MHYRALPKGSLFCPLPWIGAAIQPSGDVSSCCLQFNSHVDLDRNSNLSIDTIDNIRRSEYWNKLRSDLANGVPHKACQSCWALEDRGLISARQVRCEEFAHYLHDFSGLDVRLDGQLDDDSPVRFWDVRDTNLCNMKCVMCSPWLSSLWNEEALKHDTIVKPAEIHGKRTAVIDASSVSRENLYETILANIDHVESFYFAGGEPLINSLHWQIIHSLVERKRFDVRLSYNTNLLKLSWQGKDIIDYWRMFEEVNVSVSIDCIGTRAEYVRFGTIWSTVERNFRRLYEALPRAAGLNMTTGLMTIGGLRETLEWTKQFDFNSNRMLCNNVVYGPLWANMKIMPRDLKHRIWDEVYKLLETVPDERAYAAIQAELFDEMDQTLLTSTRQQFKRHVSQLDGIRQTDIRTACPELTDFYLSIED